MIHKRENWGEKEKARSKNRLEYFKEYAKKHPHGIKVSKKEKSKKISKNSNKNGKYIRTEEMRKKASEARKKLQMGENNSFYGRHHTEETKRRISEAKKGQIPLINGQSPNLGRKASEETKQKMRLKALGNKRALGYKHTEETRKKLSEGMKGEKSSLWKGGRTPLHMQIRSLFKYTLWRSEIFKRDSYTCQICADNIGGNLQANHIIRFSIVKEQNNIKNLAEAIDCQELWDTNNGITLCKDCHICKVTNHEEEWESYFNFNLMTRGFLPDSNWIKIEENNMEGGV